MRFGIAPAVLWILLPALVGLSSAWGQPTPPPPSGVNTPQPPAGFNVRDFGAKGDGRADDTQAVQAAMDAAGKKTISEQPPAGTKQVLPAVCNPQSAIFIPAGACPWSPGRRAA